MIFGGALDQKRIQLGADVGSEALEAPWSLREGRQRLLHGRNRPAARRRRRWRCVDGGGERESIGATFMGSYQERDGDGVNVILGPVATLLNQFNRERDRKVWAVGADLPALASDQSIPHFLGQRRGSEKQLIGARGATTDIARTANDRKQYSVGFATCSSHKILRSKPLAFSGFFWRVHATLIVLIALRGQARESCCGCAIEDRTLSRRKLRRQRSLPARAALQGRRISAISPSHRDRRVLRLRSRAGSFDGIVNVQSDVCSRARTLRQESDRAAVGSASSADSFDRSTCRQRR